MRPGIEDLVSFTHSAAKEVNDPVYGSLGSGKIKQADHTTQKRGSQFHGVTTTTEPRCPACRSTGCSSLFQCEIFKAMAPSERYGLAKNDRLCFNCLKKGHLAGECRVEQTCTAKGCQLKHTKFLHMARDQSREEATGSSKDGGAAKPESGTRSAAVSMCAEAEAARVALPVTKVKLKGSSGRSARAYALLDSRSTSTFCTTGLLQRLGSEGHNATINLTTLKSPAKGDCLQTDEEG